MFNFLGFFSKFQSVFVSSGLKHHVVLISTCVYNLLEVVICWMSGWSLHSRDSLRLLQCEEDIVKARAKA